MSDYDWVYLFGWASGTGGVILGALMGDAWGRLRRRRRGFEL